MTQKGIYNTKYGEFIDFEGEIFMLFVSPWEWNTRLRYIFIESKYDYRRGHAYISEKDKNLIDKASISYSQRLENIYIDLLLRKYKSNLRSIVLEQNMNFVILVESPYTETNHRYKIFNTTVSVKGNITELESSYEDLIFTALLAFNYTTVFEMHENSASYFYNINIEESELFSVIKAYLRKRPKTVKITIIDNSDGGIGAMVMPNIEGETLFKALEYLGR